MFNEIRQQERIYTVFLEHQLKLQGEVTRNTQSKVSRQEFFPISLDLAYLHIRQTLKQ